MDLETGINEPTCLGELVMGTKSSTHRQNTTGSIHLRSWAPCRPLTTIQGSLFLPVAVDGSLVLCMLLVCAAELGSPGVQLEVQPGWAWG